MRPGCVVWKNDAENCAARAGMSSCRSRSGGSVTDRTCKRKYKSPRNTPRPRQRRKIAIAGCDEADVGLMLLVGTTTRYSRS